MMDVLPTIATTLSLWISFLASEATCPGSVCSVSMTYSTGRPLMPPLSLTQSKNALAVLGMSVKSVPGCLVAIAPILIGSPVAFCPLPRPHLDSPVLAVVDVVSAGAGAAVVGDCVAVAVVLLLSSLPHAASPVAASTA